MSEEKGKYQPGGSDGSAPKPFDIEAVPVPVSPQDWDKVMGIYKTLLRTSNVLALAAEKLVDRFDSGHALDSWSNIEPLRHAAKSFRTRPNQ